MATDTEINGSGAADGAAQGRRNLLMIAGAGLVVLMAAGTGLYVFLSAGHSETQSSAQVVAPPQTFIFNLAPMTVNLNSEDGSSSASYLRLTIALEVANEEMMLAIQPSLAKITDAFQVYLRELRRSDLVGSAGIYRLREELLRRVNVAIYPSRVESLLFKELLVQ